MPHACALRDRGGPDLGERAARLVQRRQRPTQTLFGADIVMRGDEHDHWTWRLAARITGCYKRVAVPPDARKKIADKAAAARSLRALQALPIARLVVGHGAIIDDAPLGQLADAWRRVGVDAS